MFKISDYMLIKAAAKFVGVTGDTLRNWEANGKIKPYRHPFNKYRMYKKEDLEQLLNDIEGK